MDAIAASFSDQNSAQKSFSGARAMACLVLRAPADDHIHITQSRRDGAPAGHIQERAEAAAAMHCKCTVDYIRYECTAAARD